MRHYCQGDFWMPYCGMWHIGQTPSSMSWGGRDFHQGLEQNSRNLIKPARRKTEKRDICLGSKYILVGFNLATRARQIEGKWNESAVFLSENRESLLATNMARSWHGFGQTQKRPERKQQRVIRGNTCWAIFFFLLDMVNLAEVCGVDSTHRAWSWTKAGTGWFRHCRARWPAVQSEPPSNVKSQVFKKNLKF